MLKDYLDAFLATQTEDEAHQALQAVPQEEWPVFATHAEVILHDQAGSLNPFISGRSLTSKPVHIADVMDRLPQIKATEMQQRVLTTHRRIRGW